MTQDKYINSFFPNWMIAYHYSPVSAREKDIALLNTVPEKSIWNEAEYVVDVDTDVDRIISSGCVNIVVLQTEMVTNS